MDTRKDIIVLGSLLHDIGEFMQRAEVSCRYEINENEMQHDSGKNFFSHTLWTAEFFEANHLCFPQVSVTFDHTDDNLENFAAMHHAPDTPLQWLVAEADRLSAGSDRHPGDEGWEIADAYKKERLYPIAEEVDLEGKTKETCLHRLELNPLSLAKEVIFPKYRDHLVPREGESLVSNYQRLWRGFIEEFQRLPKGNVSVFTESLVYLMEKYTWCVPSSAMDLPDVSLFDHSKTTAAIAACLYDYHESHGTLTEDAVRDEDAEKYLLVCGDVSGIQKFIYTITNKGAAKGLKGRSFLIQLFSEAAGKYVLRSFDYPVTNMLYSGGGRFYLLLAKKYESELAEIRKKINSNLLESYDGDVCLALGWCALRGKDFQGKRFPDKWREAARSTNEDKRRKFAGLEYGKIFGPKGTGGTTETCQICKKEDKLTRIPHDDEDVRLCKDCKTAEDLGKRLSKAAYLVEAYGESQGLKQKGFDTPIPDIRYYLLDKPDKAARIKAEKVVVYRLNHTDFLPNQADDSNVFGFKFAGGAGQGKTPMFGELTDRATGLKRLGILRMDVDNLGRIFSQGLGKNASISRVAGLSYQLSLFFGAYLNEICGKDKYREDTLVIYSGGDDLFVVGAWDKVIELAPEIRREFGEFACHNPSFTLSGGMAMTRKKYAIHRGAAHAGEAEEHAKDFKRPGSGKEKDALTFLSKALSWEDVDVCCEIKDMLHSLLKHERSGRKLPASILNRLREVYLLYEENRRYWHEQGLHGAELEEKAMYHKWMWRAVYTLTRAARQHPIFKEDICKIRSALLGNQINNRTSEQPIITFLDVPVRWTEFLIRKERG